MKKIGLLFLLTFVSIFNAQATTYGDSCYNYILNRAPEYSKNLSIYHENIDRVGKYLMKQIPQSGAKVAEDFMIVQILSESISSLEKLFSRIEELSNLEVYLDKKKLSDKEFKVIFLKYKVETIITDFDADIEMLSVATQGNTQVLKEEARDLRDKISRMKYDLKLSCAE
jgi:hypothetical protein